MSKPEFKPMDPFDVHRGYMEEFGPATLSMKTTFSFSPNELYGFLRSGWSVLHHKKNLETFKGRVERVGLIVANLAFIKESAGEGGYLTGDEVAAHQQFYSRLETYASALEADRYNEVKQSAGNVACSVNPVSWHEYRDDYDVPELGLKSFSNTAKHLGAIASESTY